MWTDQELNQYAFDPEADPVLGHFAVIMYVLAAVAATALTIFMVIRSPMHG